MLPSGETQTSNTSIIINTTTPQVYGDLIGTTMTTSISPNDEEFNSYFQRLSLHDDFPSTNLVSIPTIRAQIAANNYCGPSNPSFPSLSSLSRGVYSDWWPNAGRLNYANGRMSWTPMSETWSKLLKEKLRRRNPNEVHFIWFELKNHVCELMINRFGSRVIENLFEVCSQIYIDSGRTNRLVLDLTKGIRRFKGVCIHRHGSGLMLKLLEKMLPVQQKMVVLAITPITLPLSKSGYGINILGHCFQHFSFEDNKGIFEVIARNFIEIAMDKNGCRVAQQYLLHARIQIIPNAFMLSKHPYGNYVVQYALSLRRRYLTENILSQLLGRLYHLCTDKYGSNVVEKCLIMCDDSNVDLITREISQNDRDFERVMTHQYGNYVVQSMLEVTQGSYRRDLCKKITSDHYLSLHFNVYGNRVFTLAKSAQKVRASWRLDCYTV